MVPARSYVPGRYNPGIWAEGLPFPAGLLQRLQRDAHSVTAEARAARPRSICPVGPCTLCGESGWLTQQFETKKPAAPAAEVDKAAPTTPRLRVVMVGLDGEEIPFKEGQALPAPSDLPAEDDDEVF